MEATVEAMLIADVVTTLHNQAHGAIEENPILGKRPSPGSVLGYNLAVMAIHPLVTYILPRPWRELFQCGTIMVETYALMVNFSFRV